MPKVFIYPQTVFVVMCAILRINIIYIVILAAFTGTLITMKMLKQFRHVSEANCFLFR